MGSNEKLKEYLLYLQDQNTELLSELYNATIIFLIEPHTLNYQEELSTLSIKFGVTSIIFKNVAHGVLALYNEALKQVSPTEYIRIFLSNLKIPDIISQGLINAWNEKSGEISAYLCSKIVTNNKLVDLDWAFGVTAASDDCNHVGKTFLQIKLTTIESQGNLNVTFFELSLDQFYQFLASLEKCRSYLDFVNPK